MPTSKEVTIKELLDHLRMTGVYNQIVREVVARKVAQKKAQNMRIKVTDEELQKAADDFRRARNIHSAGNLNKWLEVNDFTLRDFEQCLQKDVLISKLSITLRPEKLTEEDIRAVVPDAPRGYVTSLKKYRVDPYVRLSPLKPIFDADDEANAVAGIRG